MCNSVRFLPFLLPDSDGHCTVGHEGEVDDADAAEGDLVKAESIEEVEAAMIGFFSKRLMSYPKRL